jgi:DUF4097 and DUF4098 domain-containing protein YvlB
MRQSNRLLPAVLLLVATAPLAAPDRVQVTDRQAFDTDRTPRVSLKNINGDVVIEAWDQNRIEVELVKTAPSEELLERINVTMAMDDNHLRIESDLDEGNYRGDAPSVDFTLRVPRGARIHSVELVNGNAEVLNVEGDVEISSVNGEVSGKNLGGEVDLATVNGAVSLVAKEGRSSIRMHSVNGGVLLVLPEKFDARIKAGTLHGDIVSIEGMDVDATGFTGSSMQGVIGKGTMKVDLNTVNGSIEIRREGEGGVRGKE